MSSTILNLTSRSPIDGTESVVLATSGANWKATLANILNTLGIIAGTTPVTSGNNNAVLYENGSGILSASTNMTYQEGTAGGTLNIFAVQTDSTNGHTATIQVNTGLANSNIQIGAFNSGATAAGFFNSSLAITQFQYNSTNFLTFFSSSTTVQLGSSTMTVEFGSSSSWSANGTTATALTSLGPAGASTTVQEWLTVQDNNGVTRYIPCF